MPIVARNPTEACCIHYVICSGQPTQTSDSAQKKKFNLAFAKASQNSSPPPPLELNNQ